MLDVLTVDQLRTFVTMAESGSFRSGAARLSRVQSAISHAIARWEAELGVALFDRSGHRLVLTPEGQTLLANARDIRGGLLPHAKRRLPHPSWAYSVLPLQSTRSGAHRP
jgi:hypothetical protein